jgi:hypothetical protein
MNAYLPLYSTKNKGSQFSFPIERRKQGYNQVCCPRTKIFFKKWRQKLCLNLLIKKKNTQLISGKPGKNWYNKPQENNTTSKQLQNKQAHTTYNLE